MAFPRNARVTSVDIQSSLRGVYGQEGSANMNMMILVATIFLVPVGLVALYLYVSGAFTRITVNL
jgi:hypothetical protein